MEEVGNLTENFERDSVAEWHDGDMWMMGCGVGGEGFVFCEGFLFFDDRVCVLGMVWYGGWFSVCKFQFFAFLVCKIGGNGGSSGVIGGL